MSRTRHVPAAQPSGTANITGIADVPGLIDAINDRMLISDYVSDGKILSGKQHDSAAASIAFLPKNLATGMEKNYSTASIFGNTFYKDGVEVPSSTPGAIPANYYLDGKVPPFSGNSHIDYEVASESSPLGRPYWILTCKNGSNSYGLHLPSDAATFNPVPGKSYTAYWVVRGAGDSVGKKITVGWYQGSRSQATFTLTKDWALARVSALNNKNPFNCYLHMTGEGADVGFNQKMHVAAFYIQQD